MTFSEIRHVRQCIVSYGRMMPLDDYECFGLTRSAKCLTTLAAA